jgi:hypothetical protein
VYLCTEILTVNKPIVYFVHIGRKDWLSINLGFGEPWF